MGSIHNGVVAKQADCGIKFASDAWLCSNCVHYRRTGSLGGISQRSHVGGRGYHHCGGHYLGCDDVWYSGLPLLRTFRFHSTAYRLLDSLWSCSKEFRPYKLERWRWSHRGREQAILLFRLCRSCNHLLATLHGLLRLLANENLADPHLHHDAVCLGMFIYIRLCLGIGVASGINTSDSYSNAWNNQQGGSGSGALLVEAYSRPLGTFGKFCGVIAALGGIANTIPPTYCSGIDFQLLGRYFAKVPRVVWNTIGVIIYTVCALAGRNHLAEIFTNFLALMGYWVAIWVAILLEEFLIFRKADVNNYNWDAWDDKSKLPLGIAATISFLVGWAGAILSMAQVWYVGPLAGLVGDYGADMGNYVGFCWAALVFPPLRWLEKKKFGR